MLVHSSSAFHLDLLTIKFSVAIVCKVQNKISGLPLSDAIISESAPVCELITYDGSGPQL